MIKLFKIIRIENFSYKIFYKSSKKYTIIKYCGGKKVRCEKSFFIKIVNVLINA